MIQPVYEVADIIQRNREQIEQIVPNRWKLRTLGALAGCRTAAMGYHIDKCTNPGCQEIHISYNSCRNRHCPKCQGEKRESWIQNREKELLKVPYYHIVFTLPEALNLLCLYQPAKVYDALFKTAWSVIKDFAANPKFLGAQTGMISILHTWGQNLSLHPHIHCIVPGGGITASGKWKRAKGRDKYLFPVKAMSRVFRARYAGFLRKEFTLEDELYRSLFRKSWVVYCKKPFFGPAQVIEYLGRYTHKIALSNHRILSLEDNTVSFSSKDYKQGGKKTTVKLSDREFIRRFSLHILPRGFTRIRHYGFMGSAVKNKIIPVLQEALGRPELPEREKIKHRICPVCRKGKLVTLAIIRPRGPPVFFSRALKSFPPKN